jgi:outer membrane protein assembly factor BamB
MYGHDPGHSFAQPAACGLDGAADAAALVPKWLVRTSDNVTASPAVVDGVVYVGAWDGIFYALDAETGAELWRFKIDDEHRVAFGRIVSSAAVDTIDVPGVGPTPVVLFGGGATLYALAPGRTGPTLLAKVDTDPRTEALQEQQKADPPQVEMESSPAVARFPDGDRIFVGMSVHNRARIGATGLLSFKLVKIDDGPTPLRFELIYKFDPETGTLRPSMTDGSGEGLGCGGVWSSPAVHPTALGPGDGVVVFGTANCTSPESGNRESMFGLDAKTGELLWKFTPPRPPAHDVDDDFGSSPNLLPGLTVGQGSKDGWYYKRDLVHGTEVWRSRVGQPGRVNEGFSVGGLIGSPAVGESNGAPAIFATTAIATPVAQGDAPPTLDTDPNDPGRYLSIHAIDVATGAVLWRQPLAGPAYGAPTYTGGLVLVPDTFAAQLQVVDANTGALLRAFPVPGAPSSAPVPVDGSVYMGFGTRETDAEWKAFGNQAEEFFGSIFGAHPLSPFSGVAAFRVAA